MTTILALGAVHNNQTAYLMFADTQVGTFSAPKNASEDESLLTKSKLIKLRNIKNKHLVSFAGDYSKNTEHFFSFLKGELSRKQFLEFISKKALVSEQYTDIEKDVWVKLLSVKDRLGKIMTGGNAGLSSIEKKFLEYKQNSKKPKTVVDMLVYNILSSICETKEDSVTQAILSGYFPELGIFNRYVAKKFDHGIYTSIDLIIASSDPLGLFTADFAGNIRPVPEQEYIDYFSLGSGAAHTDRYIENQEYKLDFDIHNIDLKKLEIPVVFEIGCKAMAMAALNDSATGEDIVYGVVTKHGVDSWVPAMSAAMKKAKKILREVDNVFMKKYF